MNRVFKDPHHESSISIRGYAVIENFAPAKVCDELSAFYEQCQPADSRSFTITNWNNDIVCREATYAKIEALLFPIADEILSDYKPVMCVYTAKKPAPDSQMLLHQDWSLVDEHTYRSVSIWLALCDMDATNGNLQVAPYSHIYAAQPRGMNIPSPFDGIRDSLLSNHMTDLPIKKGDAIIFDHRLIHASPPNRSGAIRLAAVIALKPVSAPLIHYYKYEDDHTQLEVLSMNEDDFRTIDFFDMPNKPRHTGSLGRIPATFSEIKLEDIDRVINASS